MTRSCTRCPNPVTGQEQVCAECKKKTTLCEVCGKPHGGSPGTTRLCPPCRADRRRKPRHPHNPPWTEHDDALIREAYATHNAREIGPRLRELFPKRPRWSITRRAQVLGACTVRTKEPRWSPEEDALLHQWAWLTPERIETKLRAAGFKRTLTAVSIRMKRFEIRRTIDGLTATGLAKLLNADIHTVTKWIQRGWLVAERSGTTGDNHDRWHITTSSARAFIHAHPECIELSKLERVGSKMWFLELITGGAISEDGAAAPAQAAPASGPERTFALYGEKVTATALSEISGRSTADLLHRIDGLGMSVEQAAFGAASDVDAAPVSHLEPAISKQVLALMKRHRAKLPDMAKWLDLPPAVTRRLLDGSMPLVSRTLVRAVEILDGEIQVTIAPKTHGTG